MKKELKYLHMFVTHNQFDEKLSRNQLRALWTAYCFHNDFIVDTATYDRELLTLLEKIEYKKGWSDFDDFDNFMCAYLV